MSGQTTTIPTVMKEARERAGHSQETVAFHLGVSQPNYSKMESGVRPVRFIHLLRFAKLLGAPMATLFPDYQPSPEEQELIAHGRERQTRRQTPARAS